MNPTLLVTLHRDINDLDDSDGVSLGGSKKQQALRWGIFSTTHALTEGFFNDILYSRMGTRTQRFPLHPDKLRNAAPQGVRLFTDQWGVRTRTPGRDWGTSTDRSRWTCFIGTRALRDYLADMKMLRDLLSHGGDPFTTSNDARALWRRKKGNSMTLMGAEGFIQASTDLAAQTVLAYGGQPSDIPEWPEPRRSGLSKRARPSLPLLP